MGEVDPSRRGIIDAIIRETRTNISAHIKLLAMDPAAYTDGEAGFVREFMAQACAKEKGPAESVTPQVAILFDVKNSEEASHRPPCRKLEKAVAVPNSFREKLSGKFRQWGGVLPRFAWIVTCSYPWGCLD